MIHQPVLAEDVFSPRALRGVRQNVRKVSSELFTILRDTGILAGARTKVMRALAAYYMRFQEWPTREELKHWMFVVGIIPRDNPNLVSPRISDLINGWEETNAAGEKVRVSGGLVETLPARKCRITGNRAEPVRIRQKGSVQRQSAA